MESLPSENTVLISKLVGCKELHTHIIQKISYSFVKGMQLDILSTPLVQFGYLLILSNLLVFAPYSTKSTVLYHK